MVSRWQSRAFASQHVVVFLFPCSHAVSPADDLLLLTDSSKCLRSSMVVSSITEGCLLHSLHFCASHIRAAVKTWIDLSFCCMKSLRRLLMLCLPLFARLRLSLRHLPKCLCKLTQSRVLLAQASIWKGQHVCCLCGSSAEWWMTHFHTWIVDEVSRHHEVC